MRRLKKLLVMILVCALCMATLSSAADVKSLSANGTVVQLQTSLIVRETPDKSGAVLGSLKSGTAVKITGETDEWYEIVYNGSKGYSSKRFIQLGTVNKAGDKTEKNGKTDKSDKTVKTEKDQTAKDFSAVGYIRVLGATNINVRSEATVDSASIGRADNGQKVIIKKDCGDWYQIAMGSGSGYIMKKFVIFTEPETKAPETTKAPEKKPDPTKAPEKKTETSKTPETTKAPSVKPGKVKFPSYGEVYNIRTSLIVRSKGDASGSILGSLKNATKVTVTGLSGIYYQIRYGQGYGYISSDYVKITGEAPASAGGTINKVQETSKAPETTKAPETPKAPETTKASETKKAPETTKAPETKKTPETAKAPETSKAPEQSFKELNKTGYADVSTNLLIREKPSSSGAVLGRYASKASITVLAASDEWLQVSYHDKKAYVMKQYVTFNKPQVQKETEKETTKAETKPAQTEKQTVPETTKPAFVIPSYSEYKAVKLNVPLYHQYYPAWANKHLGNSKATFDDAGCVTTCFAMIEEYRTGKTCTPLTMESKLKYTSGGSVYWPKNTTQYTGSEFLKLAYAMLREGKPVIVGAKWSGSNAQHYVVITGYRGSTSKLSASGFTVNDPGTAGAKTLADFFRRTPRFYKLVYYK